MRKLALIGCVLLGACAQVTTAKQSADTAIASPQGQSDILLACWGVKALEAVDDGLTAAGKIPASAQPGITAGRAALDKLCTPPYPQSTDDIVKAVLSQSAQLSALIKAQ